MFWRSLRGRNLPRPDRRSACRLDQLITNQRSAPRSDLPRLSRGSERRKNLLCQSWWTARGEELFCLTRRSPCRPVQGRPHQRPARCLDLPRFRQRTRCCVVLCGCMAACQAACESRLITSAAGPAVGPRTHLVTVAGYEVGPLVRCVIHATWTRKMRTFIAASFLHHFIGLFEG